MLGGVGQRRSLAKTAVMKAKAVPWFLAWLAFVPLAVLRAGMLSESDTLWLIRTGLLIMEIQDIPRVDSFSWTAQGEPWTLNSWGFNVLLGAAYQLAGLPGVALFCAGLVAGIGGLVVAAARRQGASPAIAAVVLLAASLLLLGWFSARPQLIDYLAVLALVILLGRLLEGRSPSLALLGIGVLMILWVNLHAAVLLGVAVVGLAGALAFLHKRTRHRSAWFLGALAVSLAGAFANPYGVFLFTQTAQVKDASAGIIEEWGSLNLLNPEQAVMFALGALALVLAVRRRDPVFTAALGVALAGSVVAIRILPILLLLALPVLAAAASQPAVLGFLRRRRFVLVPPAVAGVATVTVMAAISLGHTGQLNPAVYPKSAIQAIPSGCKVFNSYLLGAQVLLERPDVLVSVDSRNDLYGAERVVAAEQVVRGEADSDSHLAGAGCVLVPPSTGLAGELRSRPEWRVASEEPTAVLFVRR
jgi:hypothetical protein